MGRRITINFKGMTTAERRAYQQKTAEKSRRKKGVLPKLNHRTSTELACRACGVAKPTTTENFYRDKHGYLNRMCKSCLLAQAKANTPLRWGLDPSAYEAAVKRGCVLCGGYKRLAVDHCHDSKRVRNILCQLCNMGLGNFRDNPALLRLAAQYVEYYAAEHTKST